MVHVKEKDINYNTGTMMVWYSKVDIPKTIYLLPEDLTLAKSFGPAFPEQYFFRHIQGNGKAAPGQRFGEKFWYKWWKKACDALGITGIDLYGGTRHSTVRHLIGQFSPEQIKRGSWQTNKAMERYLGPVERNQKHLIYQVSSGTKVEPIPVHSQKPKPS